jgi:hypothetical protein
MADADTLMSILRGDPIGPPIDGERPELRELLDCALAADKNQRFETAQAFARAIEGVYPEIGQAVVQQEVVALVSRLRDPEESGSKPALPLREDRTDTDAAAPPMSEPATVRPTTAPPVSRPMLNRTIPMQAAAHPFDLPPPQAAANAPLNRTLAIGGPAGPGLGSAPRVPSATALQTGPGVGSDGRPITIPPNSRVRPTTAPIPASMPHPSHRDFGGQDARGSMDPRATFPAITPPPKASRWRIVLLVAFVVCVVAGAAWAAIQFLRHR